MIRGVHVLSVVAIAFAAVTPMPAHSRASEQELRLNGVRDMSQSEARAIPFDLNATYTVCFTPGQNCEALIVNEIERAQRSVLLQAYSFTSPPIARALKSAKQRGVDVRAILDKSQRTEKYSAATFLKHAGIPVLIDELPGIAHSKVLILDQRAVVTGSYNFSKSARERNAENVIIIKGDSGVVRSYTDNWKNRSQMSIPY